MGLEPTNIFRAEIEKYFVRFLVQVKTVELAFEINWPLFRIFFPRSRSEQFSKQHAKFAKRKIALNFAIPGMLNCIVQKCQKSKYYLDRVKNSLFFKERKIAQKFCSSRNARFYQISAWTALQKLLNNVPEGKGNGNSKTGTTVVF